ncbi:glucosamine-fructose-6-phosphate aminotransferase [Hokovirus HKV1]|uniref:Glutamine--fructose-6-phosphate aminotransferase [isomerizing] n=1 Tax=Hokovirus HKV1 TaxID=1977638 RepID=A0A1V0SGL3_9VIRU|nr:glucosamine-fructose-6-phosphate aminotransferase [Hokovirus HKV1]
MCGICAYIGYNEAYEYLIHGLKMLQNRGYDSAGICTLLNNTHTIKKYASTDNETAVSMLINCAELFKNATIGIAHERWSTTGPKTDENSHPHIDFYKNFALVHNGIIENYEELKNELVNKHGIEFYSQTDTEVIVNLVGIFYKKLRNVEMAIKMALNELRGTYGLVILYLHDPNKLYCVRHGSPLLIGIGDDFAIIASEQSAFNKYVKSYVCLKDNDLVILEKSNKKIIFTKQNNYVLKDVNQDISNSYDSLGNYKHWTIKEIYEQPASILRALGNGGRILDNNAVKLGGLESHKNILKKIDNLIILGCGTSYNAGLYCLNLFKQISGFNTVQIFDGADFSLLDVPKIGNTAVLLLSQSGETKDLHRALEIAKENSIISIGVINVVDSLIAREVTCGVYLNAGREVGVASTKVFTSHVVILSLIAIWFAQIRNIYLKERIAIINDLKKLYMDVKTVIDDNHGNMIELAKNINAQNMFILGKNSNEAIAKEGSLKIKEISYIHSESYSTSALKHGPYALITDNIPVIIINLANDDFNRINGVIDEIKCRNGYIITISDIDDYNKGNINIKIPTNKYFGGLLSVIPLQILAYELSCSKNINPDFPRNLAKTISTD